LLRFIHITDTHIGPTPDFAMYGQRALANLENTVAAINALSFRYDFILHTGDVIESLSANEYRLAQSALSKLKQPVYYVAGNHDDSQLLQTMLAGVAAPTPRYDYTFSANGVQMVVLDTNGNNPPEGNIEPQQLVWLNEICRGDGPPLVIAMHHPPVWLDSTWIDHGAKFSAMHVKNGAEFMAAIAPAQASKRLRGIFFWHVHRAFQVYQDGVLMASAPSVLCQLGSYPEQAEPDGRPDELGGFNIVTVTPEQTIVRLYHLPRPT
jgi:3',5'-cyclic-AMP phosphodiesterase